MRNRFAVPLMILFFALSLSSAVFSEEAIKTPAQLIQEAKAQIKEVSVQDAKRMMDESKGKVIFLDVRDKQEYDKAHLPGAINMSRGLLDFHIDELIEDKNATIVVI